MKPILYIVIPCYNEKEVLPVTSEIFLQKLSDLIQRKKISDKSKIMFVNDGSKDNTWEIICELAKKDERFIGISQSRNRGHQNAVWAGLMEAKAHCDITISIDCDGQDDINAMDEMVDAYLDGNEVVYGVRSKRTTDSFFKRFTAEAFYKFMKVMGAEVVFNHADYRLLSSRVIFELEKFDEANLFLRGLVPLVGFQSTSVSYERAERIAGESHYPIKKMMGLAVDGITSLSVKPLRTIAFLGLILTALSFFSLVASIVTLCLGVVGEWFLIVSTVCFMTGIILCALGVLGEYVGKTHIEGKRRPKYIISERTEGTQDERENS